MKKLLQASLLLLTTPYLLYAQNTSDSINTSVLMDPSEVVEDAIPVKTQDADNTGVLKMDEGDDERTWIDTTHEWAYQKSQDTVVWLDTRFVAENQKVVPTPPSRFRIGVYARPELETDGTVSFSPVADFHADVDLPNLERRLKLFVSTRDPTASPGEDAFESDNALRIGASRSFLKSWDFSAGIKARWEPEPFVFMRWSPEYTLGNNWSVAPQIKPFWQSNDGFGGLTSVVFNQWNRRMLFRQSLSLKWTQQQKEDDQNDSVNENSAQFGENGEGYRWDSTTIYGYVPELLNEEDYGQRVSGDDIARGTVLKAQLTGSAVETLQANLTLYNKGPFYKDFVYYVVGPEVIWKSENDWKEAYQLTFGFEILLWGKDPYKKKHKGH